MPFQPKCKDHALIEVVFGLVFNRRFNAGEINSLIAAHDQWRADLPRLGRTAIVQIAFGDGPQPEATTPMNGGVAFDRIKPDGTLEWRLRAEEASLLVNCLAYEKWDITWPKAREFLRLAHATLGQDIAVSGIFLQYINIFEWMGKEETYQIEELLNTKGTFFPHTLLNKGPLWHLHQGWFIYNNLPVDGRMLQRTHMDAVYDDKHFPTVKIDNFLHLQFNPHVNSPEIFEADNGLIDHVLPYLRNAHNQLMRSLITEEMARKIGLDV